MLICTTWVFWGVSKYYFLINRKTFRYHVVFAILKHWHISWWLKKEMNILYNHATCLKASPVMWHVKQCILGDCESVWLSVVQRSYWKCTQKVALRSSGTAYHFVQQMPSPNYCNWNYQDREEKNTLKLQLLYPLSPGIQGLWSNTKLCSQHKHLIEV